MKNKITRPVAVALAMLVVSCGGNKDNNAEDVQYRDTVADADIRGQWFLENIVLSDSVYVRPSEEVPGSRQYIVFNDSTYSIITNCNTIAGSYTICGDTITMGDGIMTEMACDNMATEDALRRILPFMATVCVENDSTAHLDSSNSSAYIVLRKAYEPVK